MRSSPNDGSVDSGTISAGNETRHDEEHRERLTDGSDEEEFASSETVDEGERDRSGEGVNGSEDSSQDERKLTIESEVVLEDRSTVECERFSKVSRKEEI
jgi:hypothetical protein